MLKKQNVLTIQEIGDAFKKNLQFIELSFLDLFNQFNLKKIVSQSLKPKRCGFSPIDIIMTLLIIPLMRIVSIKGYIESRYKITEMKKDTFYRLLNNEDLNWRKLLINISKKFKSSVKPEKDHSTITFGIIDDTTLEKTGKRIEGIGKYTII